MELHYGVKMNHMQGEDVGLEVARRDVDTVLEKLERRKDESSVRRGRR